MDDFEWHDTGIENVEVVGTNIVFNCFRVTDLDIVFHNTKNYDLQKIQLINNADDAEFYRCTINGNSVMFLIKLGFSKPTVEFSFEFEFYKIEE